MRTHTRSVLAVIAVLALGVGARLLIDDNKGGGAAGSDRAADSSANVVSTDRGGTQSTDNYRYNWEAGTAYVWELSYAARSSTRTHLAGRDGAALDAGADIAGHLALTVDHVDSEGAMSGRLSLPVLRAGHIEISNHGRIDRDALATGLANTELWIRADHCGNMLAVADGSAGEGVGIELLRTLAQEMRFAVCDPTSPEATEWNAVEASPHGALVARYRRSGDGVRRHSVEYTDLRAAPGDDASSTATASAHAVLADNALASLVSSETLRATRVGGEALLSSVSRLSLRLIEQGDATVAALPDHTWVDPGARPVSAQLTEQLLHRRAEGLTGEALLGRVASHVSNDMPAFREFMWRAPARVAIEPELVAPLVETAAAADSPLAARSLALDVLAQTGTEAASLGLLEALQSDAVREDFRYAVLLQRASFVSDPPAELVNWVHARSSSADSDEANAATYTLGSLVAALDDSERSGEADAVHADLHTRLQASTSGEGRAHLLRALANARRVGDVATFTDFINDSDRRVRAAVASAFEDIPSHGSLAGLLHMVGDDNIAVQRTALLGLRPQYIDDGALAELVDAVEAGRILPRNERTLLEAVQLEVDDDPASVRRIGELMGELSSDPQVIAAARTLVERVDHHLAAQR